MAGKTQLAVNHAVDRWELLSTFKGKITEIVDFGQTPIGKRYDAFFEGELSGGKISGKMQGVDYILIRSDDVSELNIRASIATDDNVNISVEISGFLQNGEIKDAFVKLMTGNEKYAWLTSRIIVGRGRITQDGLEINYFFEP